MTEIIESSSGSDLSSGSWTLLDETSLDESHKNDFSDNNEHIVNIKQEILTQNDESTQNDVNKKKSNGFLSFDEFLQERLLEYDYEHQEKPQKLRRLYKDRIKQGLKKCKAPKMGIFALFVAVVTFSALATFCSTLSQPRIDREVEVPIISPVRKESVPNFNEIYQQVNDTIKELEALKSSELLDPLLQENATFLNENQTLELKPSLSEPKLEKKTSPVTFPRPTPKYPKCHLNKNKGTNFKPKPVKTKWMILKEFLLDSNIHAFVSLVMTNIYLVTLFVDIARKPQEKNVEVKTNCVEELEKKCDVEQLRKCLFKELPFWNAEFTSKKDKKKQTQKKNRAIEITPRRKESIIFDRKREMVNSVVKKCPFLSEHSLCPAIIPANIEEAGKSECQRRFEELDYYQKKYENLKQAQKNRVRLLKQKFRNEVSYIKDTEEESDARAEKINRTSQMFIRKLKFNREKYLIELKKVKELRQKVANAKRKENKDVAVGVYSISLPTIYDYGEKFKMIKEKFEREKDHLPNGFKF